MVGLCMKGKHGVASRLDVRWAPSLTAPRANDRRAGHFHPYLPDLLLTRPVMLDAGLGTRAARVENAVRSLTAGPGARGLEGLARFLLRSEAIASSRIEGLQVSPQQVALAEFALAEGGQVKGFTENARLVANNITALRRAATDLAAAPAVTVAGIEDLQRALLPNHQPLGVRTSQNWVGGSDWHPLDAEFVPPPADQVPVLMADLADYINSALHAPLIQAALVHAQFETIHPFTDGNGRVGRALIHTVLARRGMVRVAVLPVSLVMLTRSDAYVAGLTAYRYDGPPSDTDARAAVTDWLSMFLDAVDVAAEQAWQFADELTVLRREWDQRLITERQRRGVRDRPRADSTVVKLLDALPEAPLVTARSAERLLGVSFPAARNALEELAEAKILSRKQVEQNTTGYLARDVFDLLVFAERRLASTRWDTRDSPPGRPVPARPPAGA
jgi:Fic family protein